MVDVSIIIPINNSAEYLPTCLDSVINQSNISFEIIAVNDASTDGSLEILQYYADKFPTIKIINNLQNLGSGISRNTGLSVAKGKYVGFVDSDDWLDLNFYSTLFDSCEEKQSEIGVAGICNEYTNSVSSEYRYCYKEPLQISGSMALRLMTRSENLGLLLSPIMNNKIYKRNFLSNNNIVCATNKTWQDDYFSFFAMLYANKVSISPNTQYHYRQHVMSMTNLNTSSISKVDDCVDVLRKIKNRLTVDNLYESKNHEYASFVERCVASLLTMIKKTDYKNSNKNIIYLFQKMSEVYSLAEIIEYLDNSRIYDFFGIN